MIVQNTEARAIIVGDILLKPGYPTEIDITLDELSKTYPAIARKVENGSIRELEKKEAAAEKKRIDAEVKKRVDAAKSKDNDE